MGRYTDTPDDDWIIGYHPTDSGVLLATGGSGHAYKVLYSLCTIVLLFLTSSCFPSFCRISDI